MRRLWPVAGGDRRGRPTPRAAVDKAGLPRTPRCGRRSTLSRATRPAMPRQSRFQLNALRLAKQAGPGPDTYCDPLAPMICFVMPKALEEITKEAMNLPVRQRLALAGLLIESAEAAADPEAQAAWDSEIRDRIRALDEGRVGGVDYEEVMREAERRLAP